MSPARKKLAASNFARWFIGVLGRECPILANFVHIKGFKPSKRHFWAVNRRRIGRVGRATATLLYRCAVRKIARRVDVGRHVWIIKKIYRVFDDTEFFG